MSGYDYSPPYLDREESQIMSLKGRLQMARLKPLFVLASMVALAALVLSLLAVTSLPAHASPGANVNGTPRFIQFHHNFSDTALAASHLPHWSSSFKAEGKKYPYTMVGTNPANGSATTTVPVTIVPLNLVFSNG